MNNASLSIGRPFLSTAKGSARRLKVHAPNCISWLLHHFNSLWQRQVTDFTASLIAVRFVASRPWLHNAEASECHLPSAEDLSKTNPTHVTHLLECDKHALNPAFTMASLQTLPAESLEPSVNPYVSPALTEAPLRYLDTDRPSPASAQQQLVGSNPRGHSHSKTWRTPQFAAWCTGVPPFRVWRWWKLEIAGQATYV